MLQRAASNAYSWWWASHIRTKQSKWLEQSLQDMEEKVTVVLKMIEEDGDSFAKRAEMYYKKRPELIHFVEESYRAFRALAERYDLMSKELQNANSTLASAFPDQFQYPMDDDEDGSHQVPRRNLKQNPNVPNVPKHFPTKKIKALMALTSKPGPDKPVKATEPGSGMSKAEAIEEIDKLQKAILTKQTEKEFTKSSYESGLAKYWEIEEEITEMQQRVSKLQDEFGVSKEIDDNEARTLMLEAALKSCQDTLAQLQEKQERTVAEAKEEKQKIKIAREKLLTFKGEVFDEDNQIGESEEVIEEGDVIFDGGGVSSSQGKELQMIRDKIKEHFEKNSSLTVSEMADKMDELVSKVINLEVAVSSQTATIQRLRVETDELQQYVQTLEGDKASLIDGKNSLDDKMKEMEDKLKKLQELERSVERKSNHLQMQFTDASCNLDEISQKLPSVKLDDEEIEQTESKKGLIEAPLAVVSSTLEETAMKLDDEEIEQTQSKQRVMASVFAEVSSTTEEPAKRNDASKEVEYGKDTSQFILNQGEPTFVPDVIEKMRDSPSVIQQEEDPRKESAKKTDVSDVVQADIGEELRDSTSSVVKEGSVMQQEEDSREDQSTRLEEKGKREDEPNWQQLFMNGLEGKEKVILNEYTSILRNYKEVKKRLGEVENKSGDSLMELRELQIQNAHKDEEIQSLRYKLIMLQQKMEETKSMKEIKEDYTSVNDPEKDDDDVISFIVEEPRKISPVEEKLRGDIDEILEENLNFWMRFSSSFSQVQNLQSEIEDLQKELVKIEKEKKKKKDGSSTPDRTLNTDARPIYKHLKEIQTELTVWLEKSVELKDELKGRFSQLCKIQEDITRALSDGAVDEEMIFTSYQAAKFQGEVLNMQQENKKVEDELQAAVEHVSSLQTEVERTIIRLNEELGIAGSKSSSQMGSGSKNRIPLRAFIFGSKVKKPKQSLLSSMHPSWHRKY